MAARVSLKGKKLLVVGGSGYVGSEVARKALNAGMSVTSVSRKGESASSYRNDNLHHIAGDSMRPEDWGEHLEQADAVVHTIGTLLDTTITKQSRPGDPGTYFYVLLFRIL